MKSRRRLWCSYGVDHKQAFRLVAEGYRLLTEGNARIDRQRAIIARLEQLCIDSDKQAQFLTRLIEAHDQQAQLVAEAFEWVQANPLPHRRSLATPPHRYARTGAA